MAKGVLTLGIVACPRDRVRDGRVDAHRAEEHSRVTCPGRFAAQEHGESNHAQERNADIAEASLAGAICNETDRHCQDCRRCVGRNAEQLSADRTVA